MKLQDIFEATKARMFKPFELDGLEIKKNDDDGEVDTTNTNTLLVIRIVDKKNAQAKIIFKAFEDGLVSTLHGKSQSMAHIHWVSVSPTNNAQLDFLITGNNPATIKNKLTKLFDAIIDGLFDEEKKTSARIAKRKVPKMVSPGVKVTLQQSWKSKLSAAVEKLGYVIEEQGYTDSSTAWAVSFAIDSAKFNIDKVKDELRDELRCSGWMTVEFFDLDY